MMEAVRTSETSVDNYFTRQYIPEDNSELRARRRENLKSHIKAKQSHYYLIKQLVTLYRRPGFATGSIDVGFVVDKVALGQVFLRVLRFFPVNISFHRRSSNSYRLGNA
jgi:hypothetical protein